MIELLQERLQRYKAPTAPEEENALKEILQEVALYALWKADFFEVGLFQGGTSLRILHGLPRFSEDLDFMLRRPNPDFNWNPYLTELRETFALFGLEAEAISKSNMNDTIRRAVIKDSSIANQIDLRFASHDPRKKIQIKLEIDVNPPAYSGDATTFLDFPLDHEVHHQDLASNFALKIHALLCRPFLKGRDWYDFAWYVGKRVSPNLPHLEAALQQYGPWADTNSLSVDDAWLRTVIEEKIDSIDWSVAADDVRRFMKPTDLKSLDLWSRRFFRSKLGQMP